MTVDSSNVTEADQYSIQGDLPLAILPGVVSSQKNVSLKLNGGCFSSQNFEPGTSNPGMNDALNKYFTEDLPDGYEVYNLGAWLPRVREDTRECQQILGFEMFHRSKISSHTPMDWAHIYSSFAEKWRHYLCGTK